MKSYHSISYNEKASPITGRLLSLQAFCTCGWEGNVRDLPEGYDQFGLARTEQAAIIDGRAHLGIAGRQEGPDFRTAPETEVPA